MGGVHLTSPPPPLPWTFEGQYDIWFWSEKKEKNDVYLLQEGEKKKKSSKYAHRESNLSLLIADT